MQVPEFKSDIPKHLLKGANPREIYVTETLSKLEQAVNWQTNQLQALDERNENAHSKLKKFKDYAQPLLVRFQAQDKARDIHEKMTKTRLAFIVAGVTIISSLCGACASMFSSVLNP